MRKLALLAFCGALIATSGAFAQSTAQPSAEALALTRRYLAAMHMDTSMKPMLLSMTGQMVRQQAQRYPNLNDAQRERLAAAINEAVNDAYDQGLLERMAEKMVPGMATAFSVDELKALVAFYESPVGQSIIGKMPALGEISGKAVVELMPEMQADIEARVQKNIDALKLPK
jgi:hypothetical protein